MLALMTKPAKRPTRLFRPIKGFPDYIVRDDGEIFSHRHPRVRLLKKTLWRDYYSVSLYDKHGERLTRMVHRLVGEAFLGRPPRVKRGKPHLRHLNGDQLDNRVANLAWGSAKDNCADTIRHGLTTLGERNSQSKLTAVDVDKIRQRLADGGRQRVIAKEFGVSQGAIDLINRGLRWAHIPNPHPKPASRLKLTEKNVREIKRLLRKGMPQCQIADRFGIGRSSISMIHRGENWSHVDG